MSVDLGQFYREARERITTIVSSLDPAEHWNTVPGTPDWSIHDVVAHLRGIVADAATGNMEGAPGDAWTAAQVERGADVEVRDLLDLWAAQAPVMEGFLTSAGPDGMASSAVFDIHLHELDLLGAIGELLTLPDEAGEWMVTALAGGLVEAVRSAGLPALRVVTKEGDDIGDTDALAVLRTSRVEFLRARFGRRNAAQMSAYDWGGADPGPYVALMAIFGPRTEPLVERTA